MAAESSKELRKALPYYEQVANVLRTAIVAGEDEQPVRLPPERKLCQIHQVSRITIRQALELLEREGLVQRTPGRGTLTVPEAIHQWKRLRQTRVIHILTNWQSLVDVPSSYYGQIYQGICSRAELAGYRLVVQGRGHRAGIARDVQLPDPATTLGVIFVGLMNEPMVGLYTQAGHPIVCIDYWTTDPLADAIVFDCYGEGQAAADFLVRQGHRELFYIGNLLANTPLPEKESDAELLLAGMQRTLGLANLPILSPERIRFMNSNDIRNGGTVQQHAAEALDWFLALSPRPTAGVIFSMDLLKEFIALLSQAGLRCPEDLSLMSKTCEEPSPLNATCMRNDALALGQLAVDCLLDRASGRRSTPVRLAVPSRLTRGRTVRQLALD